MAIALVDSAMSADGTPTDGWSVTMPSHSSGDFLIAAISSNLDGTQTMSIQESGWTQVDYINDYSANSLLIYYKAATGTETVTIDHSTAQEKIALVAAFSGVHATPIDTAWAYTPNISASPTHAGLTSTAAGWAIAIYGHDDGSDNAQNGPNNGTASGWTLIGEDGQGGTSTVFSDPSNGGAGVGMAYKAVAATTASGAHEWSIGSEQHYAGTLILAEAAASSSALPLLNAYYG